jgi:hypothetical protein
MTNFFKNPCKPGTAPLFNNCTNRVSLRFIPLQMKPELYFDINTEESGGSLFRIKAPDGRFSFLYSHSRYNAQTEETEVFKTTYPSFEAFWQELTKDRQWFYQHPLYVHPEQRAFVQEQLKTVNWKTQGDLKWQLSHQRQWTKVLSDPKDYYTPPSTQQI